MLTFARSFFRKESDPAMRKPLILVTNDDSIKAPGIHALIDVARGFGKVVVVAPDKPQSGTGHAITINVPLRLDPVLKEKDYEEYTCSGTPVDCVKLAFKIVLRRKPDLVISGINHGSNASINIIYSGTMAGVLEGAMSGVPSVGFSLNNYYHDADMKASKIIAAIIIRKVLEKGLPYGICLNVNIPDGQPSSIKGIKVCHQAGGTWQEDFDQRVDPHGRDYYWLKGIFFKIGDGKETDQWALENHFVSVVPMQFDFTAYSFMKDLNDWDLHAE
jgi:5'-nucleotidase